MMIKKYSLEELTVQDFGKYGNIMNCNRIISLEEQKKIRFEILVDVDSFCRQHGIRYSLAFGTLLGAVRHKGFIPWDDDLDIMMPLPDMLRLKKEFISEKIKFCDIDTEAHYRCAFANLGYVPTYRKYGLVAKSFGVGVDIYPIIGIPDIGTQRDLFFERVALLQKKRMNYLKWNSRIIKLVPVPCVLGFDNAIKAYRDYLYNNSIPYSQSSSYYVIAGSLELKERMIYDCDLFREVIELPFEGNSFICIKKYDYYLKLRYGDYMQLPPVEERVPHHGQTYYWK